MDDLQRLTRARDAAKTTSGDTWYLPPYVQATGLTPPS
jgi:hypothetical protein